MKKFIIACFAVIFLVLIGNYLFYYKGMYVDLSPQKEVSAFVKTEGKTILLNQGKEWKPFEIKGVDMGAGIPGKFATDYGIDKETYLKWFKQIQEMGANTVRVYTILSPTFYEAVYEYNKDRENPLYFIHGLWVNDYVQNSRVDAFDDSFQGQFLEDAKTLIDVIHGNRAVQLGRGVGSGSYRKDISKWVIGYILGVEWEDVTVTYTNHMNKDKKYYQGTYMETTEEASPFEAMLAEVGDKAIEYETHRYKQQRLVAFSNWPTTDPFEYPTEVKYYFQKIASVDTEHIKTTNRFVSGTFASYHIYPYYPDYLNYTGEKYSCIDKEGKINTYYGYLRKINAHHSIPVIVSEFGVPSSRGMTQKDQNTGRSQGRMSEQEQGQAIVDCYKDIKDAECAGAIIFTWQDEWFKRTWNTMHSVDLTKTPFWSDYQTNEQYFGLLAFDPGKEKSVCYVDGDISEWDEDDMVIKRDNMSLSMKQDEKYLYFLAWKKDYKQGDIIYIPIDTTKKTGSNYCENYDLKFERNADFLITIDREKNSRVVVQERYQSLKAIYSNELYFEDTYVNPPDKDSSLFVPINLILQTALLGTGNDTAKNGLEEPVIPEVYETGLLLEGNGNPESKDFNSLTDYKRKGEYVEIRIPWQLLNFSNPSEMMIHDDYYEHYGIEALQIDSMYAGISSNYEKTRIPMGEFSLKGWEHNVTYHERLKASYYMVKEMWNKGD